MGLVEYSAPASVALAAHGEDGPCAVIVDVSKENLALLLSGARELLIRESVMKALRDGAQDRGLSIDAYILRMTEDHEGVTDRNLLAGEIGPDTEHMNVDSQGDVIEP